MKTLILSLVLMMVFSQFLSRATAAPVEPVRTMEVPHALEPPVLDGEPDTWYGAIQTTSVFAYHSSIDYGGTSDFDAVFRVCWDINYFYVLCEVTDDVSHTYDWHVGNPWEFDQAELFFQLDTNTVNTFYSPTTIQLRICSGLDSVECPGRARRSDYGYYMDVDPNHGWTFEVAVPWTCVLAEGALPEDFWDYANTVIGFDFMGSDSDNSDGNGDVGNRDLLSAWDPDGPDDFDDYTEDMAWNNTSVFGYITLLNTEAEEHVVADAGPDQTVSEGDLVMLDGSASTNIGEEELNYNWTSYYNINLVYGNTAHPLLTAPGVFQAESIPIFLTVDDGLNVSRPDTMLLHVTPRSSQSDIVWNTIIISVVDTEGDLVAREEEGVLYVTLYPNPADQYIRIRSDERIHRLQIFDIGGALLREEMIWDFEAEVSLGDLSAGTYLLKLFTEAGEVTKEFVLE